MKNKNKISKEKQEHLKAIESLYSRTTYLFNNFNLGNPASSAYSYKINDTIDGKIEYILHLKKENQKLTEENQKLKKALVEATLKNN
jgi:hypothetical protein